MSHIMNDLQNSLIDIGFEYCKATENLKITNGRIAINVSSSGYTSVNTTHNECILKVLTFKQISDLKECVISRNITMAEDLED